jgi:membrane protease YdiL (CAAX protease family)
LNISHVKKTKNVVYDHHGYKKQLVFCLLMPRGSATGLFTMKSLLLKRTHLQPVSIYVIVILLITLARILFPNFSVAFAALILFSTPFLVTDRMRGFKWDPRGLLIGVVVSIVVLPTYLVLGLLLTANTIHVDRISAIIIVLQLFFVAIPEEVFFRGYLQERLGNSLMGVLIVSLLFALGHFFTLCVASGFIGGICTQSILTFFPSLIMGYLYVRTGTLWGSIIFHFLSNIAYISMQ